MKIRFDDIPENGLFLSFSGDEEFLSEAVKAISLSGDVKIDPHIRGKIDIIRSGEDVLLSGGVAGSMRLRCSRCLSDFTVEKEMNLDLRIRGGGVTAEFQDGSEQQDADVVFVEDSELDPAEIILQELLLELPMKPLCREECPGLCPKCGALKGSPECKCGDNKEIDPRWEALARLKKKREDQARS
jgi:uncharacterized protein